MKRKLKKVLGEALEITLAKIAVPALVFYTALFFTPPLTPFPTTDFLFRAMIGSLAVALYFITVD